MASLLKDRAFAGSAVVLVAVALASVALRISDSGGSDDRASASAPTVTSTAAPRATPAPSPTPEPVATPEYADVLADAVRVLDLAAWADALEAHRGRNGAYPSTGGEFVTICATPSDAICALSSIDPDLHVTDGAKPYWYRSDGSTYMLVASLSIEPTEATCLAELPRELADGPVACVTSEGAP